MKVAINLSIDVTKLDKKRFFQGKKGTYADLILFVDLDNVDEYGNNGSIKISAKKEETEQQRKELPYVGNAKIFWRGEGQQQSGQQPSQQSGQQANSENWDDDIPF